MSIGFMGYMGTIVSADIKSLAHPEWPYTGTPHEWRVAVQWKLTDRQRFSNALIDKEAFRNSGELFLAAMEAFDESQRQDTELLVTAK